MCNLNEVIAKSIELNNAIKKLNEETKVLNSIVVEKRNARKEDIINDLQKYIDIMTMLDEIRNGKAKDEEERISAEVAKRVDEKLNDNLKVIEELKQALEEKETEVENAKSEQQALEEKYSQINKEMVEQLQNQN